MTRCDSVDVMSLTTVWFGHIHVKIIKLLLDKYILLEIREPILDKTQNLKTNCLGGNDHYNFSVTEELTLDLPPMIISSNSCTSTNKISYQKAVELQFYLEL